MAETVNEVILGALRLLKVKQAGESLKANEASDGLVALNDILESWNLQPLMQPAKVRLTQAVTANDGTYTFGTGGDNSTRPLEIHTAYVRVSNTDYPCYIMSNEEYSRVPFKSTQGGYHYSLYYRDSYPIGTINMYPVPSSSSTLYLECRAALSTYTAGSDSIDLPYGYLKALKGQLAVNISPEYRDPSPIILQTLREDIANIKKTNSKDKPMMANTARLATRGRRGYNYLWGISP